MPHEAITAILGIQGFAVVAHERVGKDVLNIELERTERVFRCPRCGQATFVPHDEHGVTVQDLPMSGRRVYLHLRKGRVLCCAGTPQTEHLDWVEKNGQQTLRLRWALHEECKETTVEAVAGRHGLSWETVKTIDKQILEAKVAAQSLSNIRRISIDEIARARRHKYLTVVTDLDRRKVIWVGKGRKTRNLKAFLRRVPRAQRPGLRVVAMDMWRAYYKAVAEALPKAEVVFSRFHVTQHLQKALDGVRRAEARRLEKDDRKQLFRNRWVLLKNPENLQPDQQATLKELLADNETLQKAYLLKEDFREFYRTDFRWHRARRMGNRILELAGHRLEGWIARARESALGPFEAFCNLLEKHRLGVLRYFVHRVSTGLSESMNAQINALKTRAHGYRDLDYFIYKIYQRCGTI
jgi:transposase